MCKTTMELIKNDEHLLKRLKKFMEARGIDFGGGSKENDTVTGKTTFWISGQNHERTISQKTGEAIRDFLKADKLILNGQIY